MTVLPSSAQAQVKLAEVSFVSTYPPPGKVLDETGNSPCYNEKHGVA